jgi:hypothetical protein
MGIIDVIAPENTSWLPSRKALDWRDRLSKTVGTPEDLLSEEEEGGLVVAYVRPCWRCCSKIPVLGRNASDIILVEDNLLCSSDLMDRAELPDKKACDMLNIQKNSIMHNDGDDSNEEG